MSNYELEKRLASLIRKERQITNELLIVINMAGQRRLYLDRGYSSMFDWLVRGFGYSNAAAYRRVEAGELLKAVPEAAAKLENGSVNLTNLSKVSSALRVHERVTGEQVTAERKAQLVAEIENKSGLETERILATAFPESVPAVQPDRRIVLDADNSRHSMTLSKQATLDLDRAKEVLSHKFPFATDSEIVAYALQFFLNHADPLRKKSASAAEGKPPSKVSIRRSTYKKSNGRCTYEDPVTGVVCGSRHQVQIDHIIPKALGGTDDPENLRCLCAKHNRMMAEQTLGIHIHKPPG